MKSLLAPSRYCRAVPGRSRCYRRSTPLAAQADRESGAKKHQTSSEDEEAFWLVCLGLAYAKTCAPGRSPHPGRGIMLVPEVLISFDFLQREDVSPPVSGDWPPTYSIGDYEGMVKHLRRDLLKKEHHPGTLVRKARKPRLHASPWVHDGAPGGVHPKRR